LPPTQACDVLFQSTLPRGERPPELFDTLLIAWRISIHAPARGATSIAQYPHAVKYISIHAPARGATTALGPDKHHIILFQSTLPRGERRPVVHLDQRRRHFNPRSRAGSDRQLSRVVADFPVFQSTLPRGERQEHLRVVDMAFRFQSTLPRGERLGH